MKSKFDVKLNEYLKSMIEVSFEYIGWNKEEVDSIHILCSTEESIYFHFFYSIGGNILERHKVNNYLKVKCNDSEEHQIAADNIGISDLEQIISLFKAENREIPFSIKITYLPATNKMESIFDYESKLLGSDLMEEDLLQQWIKSLKKSK